MLNKVKYRHNKPGGKFTNIKKIFENLLKIQIPIKKQFTNWQFTHKNFKIVKKSYQKTGQNHWYLEK